MIDKIKIYGINKYVNTAIKKKLGYNLKKDLFNIREIKSQTVYKKVKNPIAGDILKKENSNIISFDKRIKSYKGIRNRQRLPCRGQRTHTNAKTKKRLH